MKCEKCGSENVVVQTVNETSYKQGHGCLWTFLFGLWYIFYWACKWIAKFFVALVYYVCYWWIALIVCKVKGVTYKTPGWFEKLMQKRGKMYNKAVSYAVCQQCGYKKRV